MVTGVGITAASTCAAIRSKINRFEETRYVDSAGEWIMGSSAPLEQPWRGRGRLVQMVAPAIRDCLGAIKNVPYASVPLLLCVAENDRPGRMDGLDDELLTEVLAELDVWLHPRSRVIAQGQVGGAVAVDLACKLILDERLPLCLVAGVDSFLVGLTLTAYEERERLLTSENSNGYIPGEAGTAILLGPPDPEANQQLLCQGVGFGTEKATIESEEPLRADGMLQALRAACEAADSSWDDLDYRLTDLNGEQYKFKEASLTLTRFCRKPKKEFETWHPADCVGEIGAAIVPCVLGVALDAARKQYAPGKGVLCHFGSDDGARAALILRHWQAEGAG
jgi:3-oxoacyl-[acyl-carrier-protein] synthase-1